MGLAWMGVMGFCACLFALACVVLMRTLK